MPTAVTEREFPLADTMGQLDAALGHHLHKILVRQPIGDVPTHVKLDIAGVESLLRYIGSRAIGLVAQHLG